MVCGTYKLNCGSEIPVYSFNTAIVGTGAAGYNAADSLYSLGNSDIAIITEGVNMGTSRNTGSDKQTYYKLTLAGDGQDSVADMARTLYEGGSMHGDIALVEAAMSPKSFYKLVNIGVPFPHNRFGEYIGYKTDHDPRQRATSAGPLTSKYMTERLEERVKQKDIRIFDGFRVISILTKDEGAGKSAIGLLALDTANMNSPSMGFTLFNCTNVIYATGGPAGMYLTSVYPECHTGSSGVAFEAGAAGVNLTESQYGIASIKFRWNLSGTYQQVLPRYISTDKNGGDEKEFLKDFFRTPGEMLDAIFLKGYQWPFDPRKISGSGSSLIDILVYNETQIKGRRVYMDFMHNSEWGSINGKLDFSILGEEAFSYLENSGALIPNSPYDRLIHMNKPAVELYKNNGIDLKNEYIEIAVCAQHNNGGLLGNVWWESNLRHFFPAGEVCGTFGVYRPGGSALNSTQTGSLRAAQYICAKYNYAPLQEAEFKTCTEKQVEDVFKTSLKLAGSIGDASNILKLRYKAQKRMTAYGAHIRSLEGCQKAISECIEDLKSFESDIILSGIHELNEAFINRDILITQLVYLTAIKEYIQKGGKSRGSYLIADKLGELPENSLDEIFRFSLEAGNMNGKVMNIKLNKNAGNNTNPYECEIIWEDVRPIPANPEDYWFEKVWNCTSVIDVV